MGPLDDENSFKVASCVGFPPCGETDAPPFRIRIDRILRGVRSPGVPVFSGEMHIMTGFREVESMIHRKLLSSLVLSGLLVGSAVQTATANDPKPGDQKPAAEDSNINSKVEKPAPMPDFAGVYGLPFESLQGLGYRLTEARHKSDPVALAMLGTELAVAEKVSGKKADVTSDAVLKEAAELARMRRQEKELVAVALIVKDEGIAKELAELAMTAQKEEAARVASFKSGEKAKGIRILEVINDTHHRLSIRVNGVHIGWVPPYSVENFQLHPMHHNAHQIWLNAHDHFGNHVRAHAETGQHHRFTWNITEG
jgi:hypothetical protein